MACEPINITSNKNTPEKAYHDAYETKYKEVIIHSFGAHAFFENFHVVKSC